MFNKSYKTEIHSFNFNKNLELRLTVPCSKDFEYKSTVADLKTPTAYLQHLSLAQAKIQVLTTPTDFHPELNKLLSDYAQKMTLLEFIENPLVKVLQLRLIVNPTKFEAGIIVNVLNDGLNQPKSNAFKFLLGSVEQMYTEATLENKKGIFFQDFVTKFFTSTDFRQFKGMKPTEDGLFKTVPYDKEQELDKFLIRRNKKLDYRETFNVALSTAPEVTPLVQARARLGFPDAKIAMKVFKGVKNVNAVAFYID